MTYVIRCVESVQELAEAFDLMGAQFDSPLTHVDRRFFDLARRFPEDRSLMVVVTNEGRIVGGALAFRTGHEPGPASDVTLRIIALVAGHRGQGLGRRLVERVEQEATNLGARGISLGADEAVGFYHHLGYRGRSGMRKELLLSTAHREPRDRRRVLEELRERRQARLRR
jgi:GNAT superfamily N-acetyltransferase